MMWSILCGRNPRSDNCRAWYFPEGNIMDFIENNGLQICIQEHLPRCKLSPGFSNGARLCGETFASGTWAARKVCGVVWGNESRPTYTTVVPHNPARWIGRGLCRHERERTELLLINASYQDSCRISSQSRVLIILNRSQTFYYY